MHLNQGYATAAATGLAYACSCAHVMAAVLRVKAAKVKLK